MKTRNNPIEAGQTNTLGIQNVIGASQGNGVQRVLFIKSDKAFNPTNVMGELLMTAANSVLQDSGSIFLPPPASAMSQNNLLLTSNLMWAERQGFPAVRIQVRVDPGQIWRVPDLQPDHGVKTSSANEPAEMTQRIGRKLGYEVRIDHLENSRKATSTYHL